MKHLIVLALVSTFATSAFAEVVCQTEKNDYSFSILTGDTLDNSTISPVVQIQARINQGKNRAEVNTELKNVFGGYVDYLSGFVSGEHDGRLYSLMINSTEMHVLRPTNDSVLRIKYANGNTVIKKMTCMTDGD